MLYRDYFISDQWKMSIAVFIFIKCYFYTKQLLVIIQPNNPPNEKFISQG